MSNPARKPQLLLSALLSALTIMSGFEATRLSAAERGGKNGSTKGNDQGCRSCISTAASLFARGQNNQAIQLLRQWSDRCPNSAQLHLLLSTILLRTGASTDEVEAEAGKAAAAAPSLLPARLQYALALTANKHPLKATEEFKKVTELDPGNYEAWTALSSLYKQLHEDELAVDASAKAAELEPGTRNVRFATLTNLKRAGKIPQAKAELKRMLSVQEYGAEFVLDLAREALLLGAYDEAIEAGERVSGNYKLSAAPLKIIALAQLCRNNFAGCLEAAERILRLDAKNAEALSVKGLALCRMGHLEEAAASIDSALASQPGSALALLARGTAQGLRGEYADSIESLRSCLDADASNNQSQGIPQTLARLELARLLRKQGEANEAEEEARAAGNDKRFAAAALGLAAQAQLARAAGAANLEAAEHLAQQALEANGKEPEALLGKSLVALSENKLAEARDLALKASQIAPGSAEPFIVLARICASDNSQPQEKQYLDKALALSGKDAETLFLLGRLAFSQGETARAIELLNLCLQEKLKAPEAAFTLACCLEKSGSSSDALKYYRKSLAQGLSGKDAETARSHLSALGAGKSK